MPFDQTNFTLPAVETDEVLRELTATRALIADPSHWGKVHYREGERYCVSGAARQVGMSMASKRLLSLEVPATFRADPVWRKWVPQFNDHPTTTHADVLALFDRAIAARRAEIASTPA